MDEKNYTKGFNHGYIIAEHKPDLAEKLSNGITSKGSYENGFKAGKKEFDKERPKSKADTRIEEMRKVRNKGKGKKLGREI